MQKSATSILVLSLLLFASEGKATDTTKTIRNKIFKTIIHTDKIVKGYVENIKDSTVIISPRPVKFNPFSTGMQAGSTGINYNEIRKIEIRRKGSVGRGALIGGLSGMLTGVLAGLISGDDKPTPEAENFLGLADMFDMTAGQKAFGGGVLGLISGGIIGGIIGAVSQKKYIINGSKDKYADMREKILNKAYKVNQSSY